MFSCPVVNLPEFTVGKKISIEVTKEVLNVSLLEAKARQQGRQAYFAVAAFSSKIIFFISLG